MFELPRRCSTTQWAFIEARRFPVRASPRLCSPQVPLLGAFFFKSGRKQQTLLGFTSLGESPHPPAGTLGRILSRASTTTSDCPAPALQSLNRGSVGWALSSLPPLPRFPTFSADPESSLWRRFWVSPRVEPSVATRSFSLYKASVSVAGAHRDHRFGGAQRASQHGIVFRTPRADSAFSLACCCVQPP
jgi:hypothetical protein